MGTGINSYKDSKVFFEAPGTVLTLVRCRWMRSLLQFQAVLEHFPFRERCKLATNVTVFLRHSAYKLRNSYIFSPRNTLFLASKLDQEPKCLKSEQHIPCKKWNSIIN